MGNIVTKSAPYLYPFVIEFSLIVAAILFVMWLRIGKNPRYKQCSMTFYKFDTGESSSRQPFHLVSSQFEQITFYLFAHNCQLGFPVKSFHRFSVLSRA